MSPLCRFANIYLYVPFIYSTYKVSHICKYLQLMQEINHKGKSINSDTSPVGVADLWSLLPEYEHSKSARVN